MKLVWLSARNPESMTALGQPDEERGAPASAILIGISTVEGRLFDNTWHHTGRGGGFGNTLIDQRLESFQGVFHV